jgi:hypothetical protein
MARYAWRNDWWATATEGSAELWRGVEAQHRVATMRLVDTLAEQALLEDLIEASKPPPPRLPEGSGPLHYLLYSPFRYRSPHPSRFRRGGELGVWYGAESLATAASEVGYWRWRFLMDSEGLKRSALQTQLTFFKAQVAGRAIDLSAPPWNESERQWTHETDYEDCQQLAAAARKRGLQWLRYRSVRHPPGHCGAVFDPLALSLREPQAVQTWACKVTAQRVWLVGEGGEVELKFPAAPPAVNETA